MEKKFLRRLVMLITTVVMVGLLPGNAFAENGISDRIQIQVIPSCSYQTHVQNVGWQDYVKEGEMSGTEGMSYRLEGIRIALDAAGYDLGIQYQTHIQNIGWEEDAGRSWKTGKQMSGTEGLSYRLEAIQIKLTGADSDKFDIYYQVHAQNFGWMDWAKNGECAGTSAYGYRLEGIKIVILPVGSDPPGDTAMPYERKEFANKDEALEYFIQYCKANGRSIYPDYDYDGFSDKGYRFWGKGAEFSSWTYFISPKGSIYCGEQGKYLVTIQGDESVLLLESDEDFIQHLTDYLYDNNLYVPEYIVFDGNTRRPYGGRVYIGYDMFGTEQNRFFRYEIYPGGELQKINMY